MMKLYGGELSPYVRKVKMALYQKGLDCEFIDVTPIEKYEEMCALSPRGEMPVLVDGDVVVNDSTIILQYLEDEYPEPPLLPADPAARVQARALEDLADRLGDALVYALARPYMWGESELMDTVVPAAQRELGDLYAYLDAQLEDGKYLCGALSWAELAFQPHLTAARAFGHGPDDAFPRVDAWLRRLRDEPGVARNMTEVRAAAQEGLRITRLPAGHPLAGHNFRAERAEFFLRNGLADYLRDGLAAGKIRVGVPLVRKA